MDLKKFISESLYQIISGIVEAQEKIAEFKGEGDAVFNAPYIVPTPISENKKELFNVDFDVAVTVTEGNSVNGGAGLSVMGLSIGGGETHSELLTGVRYISQVYSILLLRRRGLANRKLMGLPGDGTSTLEKQRGYAP